MTRWAVAAVLVVASCATPPAASSPSEPPAREPTTETARPGATAATDAAKHQQPSVEELVAALSADDEEAADRAADALRTARSSAATALAGELRRRRLRVGAARRIRGLLDELPESDVVPALVEALGSASPDDRTWTLTLYLGERAPRSAAAFRALMERAFRDESADSVLAAAALTRALHAESLAPEVDAAARSCESGMEDRVRQGDLGPRTSVACALLAAVSLDRGRSYRIIRDAYGRSRSDDESILQSITSLGRRAEQPVVVRMLEDPEAGVRLAGLEAMRERAPDAPPLEPFLAVRLLTDPDERVAVAAALVLGAVARPIDERALHALRATAASSRERPARAASIALREILDRR